VPPTPSNFFYSFEPDTIPAVGSDRYELLHIDYNPAIVVAVPKGKLKEEKDKLRGYHER
jgi:hypothetical protein